MTKPDELLAKQELTREDLIALLSLTDPEERAALYRAAYEVKRREVGTTVHFRGLIEWSNRCRKDCYYCGIRQSNAKLDRYDLSEEEILEAARFIHERGYGSLVLQGGERQSAAFTSLIEGLVQKIKALSNGELGITLSLGEQTPETYARWFAAGAHRYLLRIETSNPALYKTLHPADHSFETRVACLQSLRAAGYQVGTGVMIGLPGQTAADLADDILFFKALDVDMIGMGPFIPHHDTPLADSMPGFDGAEQLARGLVMIAVTRLYLKDVNIAAATALQALRHDGRELGLLAGANILMPNVTEPKYRRGYQLYDGKPCLDENAELCSHCLERRIAAIGETIGYGQWGDSRHAAKRRG